MKLENSVLVVAVLGVVAMTASPSAAEVGPESDPYAKVAEIQIGGEGGWDYLSVDSAGRRLYVSHASKVVVVDVDKNTVVGEISPTPGVHGIALAPELGRGYVSNGRESTVSVVELKTLQTITKVTTGENPDAILYEPVQPRGLYLQRTRESATVFDAKTGEVRGDHPSARQAGVRRLRREAGRIYNNIEDTNQLVAIDSAKHAVVATWPIAPGEEASGLAIDPRTIASSSGCSNKLMLMVDAANGKVLGSVPIGDGVDANAFDPRTGLAFASSGDGTLTMARAEPRGSSTVVQTIETATAVADDDDRPDDAQALPRGRRVRPGRARP